MRGVYRFLSVTALLVLFLATSAPASNPVPEVKRDCSVCHVSDKTGVGVRLKKPINELCLECHPDRAGQSEHRVGMAPPVPADELPLPLSGGIVTCSSCHEPHGLSGFDKMLRASRADLCFYCHRK